MGVVSYPQREWARMSSGANALGTGQTSAHAELSLIDALRRGDGDAFGRLVDQYHTSLRRVARLYVSNRAVADEVVQDTWVGVIQGIWAFEGRSSLRTWIFRILINHAKTRAVREGRTVPFAGVGADDVDGPEAAVSSERFRPADHPTEPGHWTSPPRDIGTSPEGRLLSREAGEQLQKAIDALPPNQRLVLTLRDIEGCSTEEVCNALGIRETNGRVLLHRARARVRAALEPYLGGA
jgi:RNA polymerase sigma-70 factor (ECF subfamily)